LHRSPGHPEATLLPHTRETGEALWAAINSLYARLAQSGKRNGNSCLSALSIRYVHAILRRALIGAIRWGRLSRNPIDAADPPRVSGLEHEMKSWSDSGCVFTEEDGMTYHPEVAGRFSRQAVKRAMLAEIRLDDLWHTPATLALRAGIHPKIVSERLARATASTTLDTYSHAIPARQDEKARIGDLVFAAK
jgi:hypothetical protein